jgi:SOS-response transcriptional repressor LexA
MITERQLELLGYINLIFNTRGEIPTYEEMKRLMKVKSKDTISNFIDSLVSKGYLVKSKLGKGNLIITEKGQMNEEPFRLCPMCGHLYQPSIKFQGKIGGDPNNPFPLKNKRLSY